MIEGIEITLAGTKYIAAPANMAATRAWMVCQNTADVGSVERFDGMMAFIHASLKRNYPEMTIDDILEHVDGKNLVDVMRAVQGVSGLKPAEASGEPKPGEALSPSTGTGST